MGSSSQNPAILSFAFCPAIGRREERQRYVEAKLNQKPAGFKCKVRRLINAASIKIAHAVVLLKISGPVLSCRESITGASSK
jgi:hypothetical protein